MSEDDLRAEIERLKNENQKLVDVDFVDGKLASDLARTHRASTIGPTSTTSTAT